MEQQKEERWLGNVSLMDISRGLFQNGYLGYSIFHAHWRQGYGYESVRALILFAFDVLELHRVEAGIEPDNMPSKHLAEKLGMRFEGRSERRLFVRDAGRTIDLYALTREERDKLA